MILAALSLLCLALGPQSSAAFTHTASLYASQGQGAGAAAHLASSRAWAGCSLAGSRLAAGIARFPTTQSSSRGGGLALRMADDKKGDGKEDTEGKYNKGVDDWVSDSAAKADSLEKAFELQVDCFTLDCAKLLNKAGKEVDPKTLRGRSVALFFYAEWCPACREFLPYMKRFYEEQKGKIELVFVSSDDSKEDALASFNNHGDWLMLDYDSPKRDEYKLQHGVWSGREAAKFGTSIAALKGRKSGVPAVMVLMLDGEVCRYLPAEQSGVECLLKWDVEEVLWPK
mmetsp:Transcript_40137/g.78681  ORF Transcript_40137/g.78681 Transcript_40137/m.78681 type:complete len:285 (+) Transcript_40137:3-857(+)